METGAVAKAWSLLRGALGFDHHEHRHQEDAGLDSSELSEADRLGLLKGMLTD